MVRVLGGVIDSQPSFTSESLAVLAGLLEGHVVLAEAVGANVAASDDIT